MRRWARADHEGVEEAGSKSILEKPHFEAFRGGFFPPKVPRRFSEGQKGRVNLTFFCIFE